MQLIDESFKSRNRRFGWHLAMPLPRGYCRIEVSKLDCAGRQGRYSEIGAGIGNSVGLLNAKLKH